MYVSRHNNVADLLTEIIQRRNLKKNFATEAKKADIDYFTEMSLWNYENFKNCFVKSN